MYILVAGRSLQVCKDICGFLNKLGYAATSEVSDYGNILWDSLPDRRGELLALAVPYPAWDSDSNFAVIKALAGRVCPDLPVICIGLQQRSVDFHDPAGRREEGVFNSRDLAAAVRKLLPSAWRTK